jgi:hypothetical protein
MHHYETGPNTTTRRTKPPKPTKTPADKANDWRRSIAEIVARQAKGDRTAAEKLTDSRALAYARAQLAALTV